jgi:acyl carrier protein
MDNLERDVRAFIVDNFLLVESEADLSGDTSLTRSGFVDSVGIVELMHFLETHYGIEIADEEAVPDNIDTIDNIVRYLRGKLGTSLPTAELRPHDARV